jgi:hypothetical protein
VQKDRVDKIDSEFDIFKSEVKGKIDSIEDKIDAVEESVSKIGEKQKEAETTINQLSDKKIAGVNMLDDMKHYLEYNKQYNEDEKRRRIEKKSKKELDELINLHERISFRKRNSKSAEKSVIFKSGKRIRLATREANQNSNYTTFGQESKIRNSFQQIKYAKDGRNSFKIPPIKTSHKKFTPKNFPNVDFISLADIDRQTLM